MDRDFFLSLLMIFTYSFILGIAFGVFYPIYPQGHATFWPVVIVLAIITLGIFWFERNKSLPAKSAFYLRIIFYCFLILTAFLIGQGRYSLSLGELFPGHITEYLSETREDHRVVEGRVVAAPEIYEDRTRLRIRPERVWETPAMETEYEVSGGDILVQVRPWGDYDYDYFAQNQVYGHKLRVSGELGEPMDRTVPRGFSYKDFLNNMGMFGTMWTPQTVEIIDDEGGNPVVSWSLALQEEMLKVIKLTMPYPQSAFLGGATLGLREGLDYTTTPFMEPPEEARKIDTEFRGAGTMHVLAVSGLHVGVIAAAFWALFAGLRIPAKFYVPLIIASLVIFTIITGARPATVRAAIMTSLMLLAFAFLDQGLRNSVLVGVSVAALLILLFSPRYVFEASFTLSFAAVLCLALISGPVDQILQKLSGLSFILFWIVATLTVLLLVFYWNTFLTWYVYMPYIAFWALAFWYAAKIDRQHIIAGGIGFLDVPGPLRSFIAMQFAIQIGMMLPLSAYYFQEYPFAGIFANFAAIPLVSVVVPLGLFAGLLGLIPTIGLWLALVLNAGNYLAVTLFLWVSHIAVEIFPYPAVRAFTFWHLLVFYGGLAVFIWWDSVYGLLKRFWFWLSDKLFDVAPMSPSTAVASFIGLVIVLVFLASFRFHQNPDKLELTFIDVGYGEAIALRTPAGSNFLFNAGSRKWDWHDRDNRADRRDEGRETVSKFFLNHGVKTLDLLALQSAHPRRSGGMAYIAEHFVIDRAMGPFAEEILAPPNEELTRGRFVQALQDDHYSQYQNADWFQNDYYGNWERWWKQLQRNRIPYERAERGRRVYAERNSYPHGDVDLEIYALNPPPQPDYNEDGAANQSIVFQIQYGDVSFLLPGDIEREAQEEIMAMQDLYVDNNVMSVPASGAGDASFNSSFLDAVDPDYVVFSSSTYIEIEPRFVADGVESTLEEYRQHFPIDRLFFTDTDGSVIFRTDGRELEAIPYSRPEEFHDWDAESEEETGDVRETGW